MIALIKKFIKKPVVIEAFEWDGKSETLDSPDIKLFMANNPHFRGEQGSVFIHTLDGVMEARPGDFIVKGIKGDIYPCKADVFWKTYEEILPEKKEKRETPPPTITSESKPSPGKKEKKIASEIPDRFKSDIEALVERTGSLEELNGEVLEIDLQELNKICPRVFVKTKSYMGLIGYLKKAYNIELKITSQRSK